MHCFRGLLPSSLFTSFLAPPHKTNLFLDTNLFHHHPTTRSVSPLFTWQQGAGDRARQGNGIRGCLQARSPSSPEDRPRLLHRSLAVSPSELTAAAWVRLARRLPARYRSWEPPGLLQHLLPLSRLSICRGTLTCSHPRNPKREWARVTYGTDRCVNRFRLGHLRRCYARPVLARASLGCYRLL